MKSLLSILLTGAILLAAVTVTDAGVLVTGDTIINGNRNLTNPLFADTEGFDSGIGAAVTCLLSGELAGEKSVKVDILRAALSAKESLPHAHGLFEDDSSRNAYDTLVMYDLTTSLGLFADDEKTALKNSLRTVLSYYLDHKTFAWEQDAWSLGATSLRIAASCILYALNFPEDGASERYLKHGTYHLVNNLKHAIDENGAWLPDSPGYAGDALRYIFVAAKALKNAGFQNHFSNPNLGKLLLYEMNLTPPRQGEPAERSFMIASIGQTDPGVNHGGNAVIAAADVYPYYPNEASYLIWYWNQCDNPVDPLGLLFIDTSIPYMRPDGQSMLAGAGLAVLRHNFATERESAVFTGFGPPSGTVDREHHQHSDSGDFSFVWSGIPLIVHDGFQGNTCVDDIMGRHAWRHNLVLYRGAGDSPVIPEGDYPGARVREDVTGSGVAPADYYPDGISQFLSTDRVDYVAGPVSLSATDMPSPAHYRHFLFLKPDALLVWDQVESSYPLEWNLWLPVDRASAEGGMLRLSTGTHNVELHTLFAGDEEIDFEIEEPPRDRTWDWPFVMQTGVGQGKLLLVTADLIGYALTDRSGLAMNILENILCHRGRPERTCVISRSGEAENILANLGLTGERLAPPDVAAAELSGFSLVLVDGLGDHDLDSGAWKINEYLARGGMVIWMARSPAGFVSPVGSESERSPAALFRGKCSVTLSDAVDSPRKILLAENPIWTTPHAITAESWFDLGAPSSGETDVTPAYEGLRIFLPTAWSDSWEILAAVRRFFPLSVDDPSGGARNSRVRVHHPASKDFFTLLLPRVAGEPYKFTVIRHGPGFIELADPETKWVISAGKNDWTDANLSVKITRDGGDEVVYAFDCTYVALASGEVMAESPMSFSYDSSEDHGTLMTTVKNTVTYPRGKIIVHAGEMRFNNLFGLFSLARQAYVTDLRVADSGGDPARQARVYGGGRFLGATDATGRLTLRWTGQQPEIAIRYRGTESHAALIPDRMAITLGGGTTESPSPEAPLPSER